MKSNKKGFTLVELLAVIIILGVLMIIAIPAVTKYINDSRRAAYITTAKEYIKEAKKKVVAKEYKLYDKETTYYIPIANIPLENEGDSPYGEWIDAYVVVIYEGNSEWKYYWTSLDKAGFKIDLTEETELDENDLQNTTSNIMIDTNLPIGTRTKIVIVPDE